jgi:thiamine biosynthesis lipoprotein
MECLEIALHLYRLTGGAFDVSIGSGLERLSLEPEEFTVHALEGGASLDLGGVGKGYAVDRVGELLEEWDLPRALVHGGFSSVLALDPPPGRDGWPLTLSAPGQGRVLDRVEARRKAFSASGVQKGEHIRDPRTGRSSRDRAAAWVAVPWRDGARAAAVADALSTAFMLQTAEEIAHLCAGHPGLEAWLVPESGEGPEGETTIAVHLGAPGA